jgi:hypothetical protein
MLYSDRPQHTSPNYSGKLIKLGSLPTVMARHNKHSMDIIVAILTARGKAPYEQLCDATFGHRSGDIAHPHSSSFVQYALREKNGWLVVA